jgi:hypothetical protein
MTAAVPHSLCKSVETTVSVYVSKVRSLLAAQQNQVLNEGRVGVCVCMLAGGSVFPCNPNLEMFPNLNDSMLRSYSKSILLAN